MANPSPKKGRKTDHLFLKDPRQSATGDSWWTTAPRDGFTETAGGKKFHYKSRVEIPRQFDEWSIR